MYINNSIINYPNTQTVDNTGTYNFRLFYDDVWNDQTIDKTWFDALNKDPVHNFKLLCNICVLNKLYISYLYDNKNDFYKDFPKTGAKEGKWHVSGEYAFRDFIPISIRFPGSHKVQFAAISFKSLSGMTEYISFVDDNKNYNISIKLILLNLLDKNNFKIGTIGSSRQTKHIDIANDIRTIMDTFATKDWKEFIGNNAIEVVGDTVGFISVDDKIYNMVKSLYDIKCVSISLMKGYRRQLRIKQQSITVTSPWVWNHLPTAGGYTATNGNTTQNTWITTYDSTTSTDTTSYIIFP